MTAWASVTISLGWGSMPAGDASSKWTEGFEEVALRRRAQERGRNALAHHIRDDQVNALILVLVEVVEIAVDLLARGR